MRVEMVSWLQFPESFGLYVYTPNVNMIINTWSQLEEIMSHETWLTLIVHLRCSYCLLTTQWLPSFYGNYEKTEEPTHQPMCDSASHFAVQSGIRCY